MKAFFRDVVFVMSVLKSGVLFIMHKTKRAL